MDTNKIFRDWLNERSQYLELTPKDLSDLTDGHLSAASFVRLMSGNIPWSLVQAEDKVKTLLRLEAILGLCPVQGQLTASDKTESRPTDTEAPSPITDDYLQNLGLEEILWSIEETDYRGVSDVECDAADNVPESSDPLGQGMLSSNPSFDPFMEECPRCGARIWESNGGRCPKCGRPTDGSH